MKPSNWPKHWETAEFNVMGIVIKGSHLLDAFVAVKRAPVEAKDLHDLFPSYCSYEQRVRCADRVLALLKRPGFIVFDNKIRKWRATV